MSRGQRLGLIAAAVAVAVAAFIILRPDDDEKKKEPEPAPAGQTPPAQPGERDRGNAKPATPEVTVIEVDGGEPEGGVEKIEVEKGERVRLEVRSSDTSERVHVHGYDLLEDMAPGKPARFSFEADIEGIFEVELEGTHEQLAELRIEP